MYTFKGIIGQQKGKNLLLSAFRRGKISHAYLFQGPSGVGKKLTAHAVAAFLNCHNQKEGDACCSCPSCKKMASGNHPDFHVISPQGNRIKIDQIRQLIKQLAFPPFESPYRIVLLADIQHLGLEAANSLLKTLEEPPEQTILILTVDDQNAPLPTILSRCQTIPFFSLPTEEVSRFFQQEGAMTKEVATTLASVCGGSIGNGRIIVDNNFLELRTHVIRQIETTDKQSPSAVGSTLRLAEKIADLKERLPDFLDLITLWLRDLALIQNNCHEYIANQDLLASLSNRQKKWHSGDIFKRIQRVALAKKQLAFNCNRIMVCESLFFALL